MRRWLKDLLIGSRMALWIEGDAQWPMSSVLSANGKGRSAVQRVGECVDCITTMFNVVVMLPISGQMAYGDQVGADASG